ncbi:phage protein NinX family protein [Klebsiella pneumoniae]
MSTDYSKLSDFEINSAVHNALMKEPYKIEFLGNDRIRWVRGSTNVTTGKVEYSKKSLKDYCNNPSEAWKIIVDNGISLECIVVNRHEKTWRAQLKPAYVKHRVNHKNPLRAAMIVFLMMQESKNAS